MIENLTKVCSHLYGMFFIPPYHIDKQSKWTSESEGSGEILYGRMVKYIAIFSSILECIMGK